MSRQREFQVEKDICREESFRQDILAQGKRKHEELQRDVERLGFVVQWVKVL